MGVFACSLHTEPRCIAQSAPESFNNCFFAWYSLVGIMNARLVGYQTQLIWGPVPQVAALKVEVLDICSKPFTPHGEAWSWGFSLNYMVLRMRFMANVSQPYCFSMGIFCHVTCSSQLSSFWTSLRGTYSMCGYIFSVSMRGRRFRSLLYCYLGPEATSNMVFKTIWFQAFRNRNFHILLEEM